jgi:hypothetical protein
MFRIIPPVSNPVMWPQQFPSQEPIVSVATPGHVDIASDGQIVRCHFFPNMAFANPDVVPVNAWLRKCAAIALKPLLSGLDMSEKAPSFQSRKVCVVGWLQRDATFLKGPSDEVPLNMTKGVRFLVGGVYPV